MPIHFPPISKRTFLKRTLAATAGLVLAPNLLAAEKKTDADFWALLSDSHIAADRSQIFRGVNMTDYLNVVTSQITALAENPAAVFLSGDCAFESGKTADYGNFADLLKPLREEGMNVHLTLGNHDNRERFWDSLTAEKDAPRPLADRQAALFETPRANWFMLDSLEKTELTPGLLGHEQLEWLADTLDTHTEKPAILIFHHNPGLLGKIGGLRDTEALFKIIRPRKQVKTCIFGHTHDWHLHEDASGIHMINLPPTAYVFEEGKPSGWVRAILSDDKMQVTLICTNPKHSANGQTRILNWRTA